MVRVNYVKADENYSFKLNLSQFGAFIILRLNNKYI